MRDYTFDLECPRCGNVSTMVLADREPPPRVNCGDCLYKDVEVVELTIVRVTVTQR